MIVTRLAPALVIAALLAAGCGGGSGAEDVLGEHAESGVEDEVGSRTDDTAVSDVGAEDDLDPSTVTAEAALGYPRDLLDRGRVNLVITRSGDEAFVVVSKQLHIDHFAAPPVEDRRSAIPPDGQAVALQTLIGEVVDCAAPGPVTAEVELGYTFGPDPTVRQVRIPLSGTDVLDGIRHARCTAERVLAESEIELTAIEGRDETVTTELVLSRRAGSGELTVTSIVGTVLFGASTAAEAGSPDRVLASDSDELVLPLTFVVNRCDPHAVAETTKTFGLDLWISVDGAEPAPVAIPIDPLLPDLEAALERCKVRTGQ